MSGMTIDVTIGSKETLLIDLDDALNNLNDLSGASCEYKVTKNKSTIMQAYAPIQTYVSKPMRAGCLVDTTTPGVWTSGRYQIYLRFVDNPDTPVVGPFEFSVNP